MQFQTLWKKPMSVVRDFCGHGLGRVFHAPPNVLHYGRPGTGTRLEEGCFSLLSQWLI